MEIIIRPKKTFSWQDVVDVWRYRELLYFFSWKDLKIRYKQTFIGILWAVFQPFITMIVFTVIFGKLAKIPSDNIPYPIFVYTGLLIWQFFSTAVTDASDSLVSNQNIITKVFFPRLILPLSATLTKLMDFFFASLVLIGLMFYYHYIPHLAGLLILPLLLLITFLFAAGAGMFLASINVKYRDVHYVLPFFIQMMLFVTPVIYPASIAGKYSKILALNPMTGVIKAAQAAILGNAPINWLLLGISGLVCLIVFAIGLAYFKLTEKYFADII